MKQSSRLSVAVLFRLLFGVIAAITNDVYINNGLRKIECMVYSRHGAVVNTCTTTAEKGCYFYRGPTHRDYAGGCGQPTYPVEMRPGETFINLYDFSDSRGVEFGSHCHSNRCNLEYKSGLKEANCFYQKLSNMTHLSSVHRYGGQKLSCHCHLFCGSRTSCSTRSPSLPLCLYKSSKDTAFAVASLSWCSAGQPILSVKFNPNNKVVRRLACGYKHYCNDPQDPFINECLTSPPLLDARLRARQPFFM